ncbi:hypothetical protein G6L26_009570 [Agrobacterium radiobacter]|uniref:hypothetical protein n=1 Tax=Agrobacterium tumefaciens complex TaxID=1183400 RepID=UPI00080FDA2B|nr:hypothetical protein [Agrobacterium tumefaciens]NTA05433.1 hypothetical protein [Agrobacterium tumefaciens]NTA92026.1 hypothetical protein [Agrobacterium tumefaciens]OCJ32188.1 hypothetical protein A6U90_09735 [Agrobacterium tumefaciens]
MSFDPRFEAYAQHGKAGEPMRTERVDVRLRPSPAGHYQVKLFGRWLRLRTDKNGKGYVLTQDGEIAINLVRNDA